MIPKYDLYSDNTGNFIAAANQIMTNEQINHCNDLIQMNKLVAIDPDFVLFESKIIYVESLDDICY